MRLCDLLTQLFLRYVVLLLVLIFSLRNATKELQTKLLSIALSLVEIARTWNFILSLATNSRTNFYLSLHSNGTLSRNKQFNDYYNIRWREWLSDQDVSQIAFIKSEKIFRFISVFAHFILRHTLNFDDLIGRIIFLNLLLHDFKFVYRFSFL